MNLLVLEREYNCSIMHDLQNNLLPKLNLLLKASNLMKLHPDDVSSLTLILQQSKNCIETLLQLPTPVATDSVKELKVSYTNKLKNAVFYCNSKATEIQLSTLHTIVRQWQEQHQFDVARSRIIIVSPHGPRIGRIETQYFTRWCEEKLGISNIEDNMLYSIECLPWLFDALDVKSLIDQFLMGSELNKTIGEEILGDRMKMFRDILESHGKPTLDNLFSCPIFMRGQHTLNKTIYVAKPVDENGVAAYTAEENAVWQTLIARQQTVVQGRACDEFIHGLQLLNLPQDRVPQCKEVSAVLQTLTGWVLEPVAALISFDHFFYLLANRRFPAATFVRLRKELDYLQEPDIFHEIFGHCPLLTNPAYAAFVHKYGQLGMSATTEERILLARLFWFTVEFGLINSANGLRAYGGGILSSTKETVYCVESTEPDRRPFDVMAALRTPYDIDVIQPIYYVLESFEQMYELVNMDLMAMVRQAQKVGDHVPLHPC